MASRGMLDRRPAILALMVFSVLAWSVQAGAQTAPAQQPILEGTPPAQRPIVNRPVVTPQRQVTRLPNQQVVRPGVQPGVRPGQQVRNQPGVQQQNQLGRQPARETGLQQQNQLGRQRGRQPGEPNGPQFARTPRTPPNAHASPQTGRGTGVRTIQTVQFRGGGRGQAIFRPDGRLAAVHTNGMSINRGLHGERKIVVARNGRTFVSTGPHRGYVERPYLNRGGRMYYQRTYVAGGRTYARAYRGWDYRGARYYRYVPGVHYHPAFYAWATNRWAPVTYTPAAWGWAGEPWFTAYGGYFTPYPVYRAPAFWLADFVIAANIKVGYQASVVASGGPDQPAPDGGQEESDQTPVSPQVKDALTGEVQQQLGQEQAEVNAPPNSPPGGPDVPDALNPQERVFVVSSDIDTALPSGQECGLSGGDMVMRVADNPDANQNVNAKVLSSKQGNCGAGQVVAVSVQDLQEMHNQFRQQIDDGLQQLAQNTGGGPLPQPPDTGTMAADVPPPAPDPGAAAQLQVAQTQADQIEGQVQQGASNSM